MPEEHVANIHQDDDGFESLNGNVSSDNDKVIGRALVQRNRLQEGVTRQIKDHTSWSEDSPSQQISLPSKRSGLIYEYMLVKIVCRQFIIIYELLFVIKYAIHD